MLRRCLLGFVGAASLLASSAVAKPSDITFYDAFNAFQAHNCARVDELAPTLLSSSGLPGLDPTQQTAAFLIAGYCAMQRKDWQTAYDDFAKSTTYLQASNSAFIFRFSTAVMLKHDEDAVVALEFAARQRPDALSDIKGEFVERTYVKLERAGEKALAARYTAALDMARYRPPEPFASMDYVWLLAAGDQVDAGDAAAAARDLDRVHIPQALERASVDRRFIALIDAAPERFDVRRAAEQRLADDREAMAKNPKLLRGPVAVSKDLRVLGRPQEALAVLDAALPRLQVKDAFTDLKDRENGYWEERSSTLMALGRPDEAVAALAKGAAASEQGAGDISRTLDLAERLSSTGKPAAALDALGRVRDFEAHATPYAYMIRAQTRVCALSQLGRTTEAAADRAFLSTHEADGWGLAADAALCAGDLDGAAAIYVRSLADPVRRAEALVSLSEFDPDPYLTQQQQAVETRRRALAQRPDVQAAIAKAGRVMRFHVLDAS